MDFSSTSKISLLVPCAGFGTRVGSPAAKEMLPHPETGRPLIDRCLQIAAKHGWPLVLMTRPEKKDFMEYVTAEALRLDLKIQWVLVKKP